MDPRQTEPRVISIPDAERLVLQSRFVRNQLEAEILSVHRGPYPARHAALSPPPFPEIS